MKDLTHGRVQASCLGTLELHADTIVVLVHGDTHTFVCFKYTEKSLADASIALEADCPTQIKLSDGNGEFVNGHQYHLTKVEAPNRGGSGGRDNVLIVESLA